MTIADDMVKLKPCPCCHSSDLLEETIESSSGRTSVQFISCNCGMSGNKDAWNTRAALEGSVAVPTPTEAMAKFIMWCLLEGSWQGADIDGEAAQDKAEALGLIVATTYDPAKHGSSDSANPGDRWFVPSPELLAALPPQDGKVTP